MKEAFQLQSCSNNNTSHAGDSLGNAAASRSGEKQRAEGDVCYKYQLTSIPEKGEELFAFHNSTGKRKEDERISLIALFPQLGLCSTMDPSAETIASNRHRGTLLGTALGPEAFLRAQRWEICLSYNHRVVWVGRAL